MIPAAAFPARAWGGAHHRTGDCSGPSCNCCRNSQESWPSNREADSHSAGKRGRRGKVLVTCIVRVLSCLVTFYQRVCLYLCIIELSCEPVVMCSASTCASLLVHLCISATVPKLDTNCFAFHAALLSWLSESACTQRTTCCIAEHAISPKLISCWSSQNSLMTSLQLKVSLRLITLMLLLHQLQCTAQYHLHQPQCIAQCHLPQL